MTKDPRREPWSPKVGDRVWWEPGSLGTFAEVPRLEMVVTKLDQPGWAYVHTIEGDLLLKWSPELGVSRREWRNEDGDFLARIEELSPIEGPERRAGGSCETCRYWKYLGIEESRYPVGLCRRYAPSPGLSDDDGIMGVAWPETFSDDWCGDFEEKESA